jgi:ADP-ribose pyrophosphatase
MRTDHVVFGTEVHARDYVTHFGAVAVVALDERDQVLVIQQYRHPLAARLWEIPAGLLDRPDEDPLVAAQRELAEEAGVLAAEWHVLVDYATTPGGSTELLRIYLARDLSTLAERPMTQEAEEQDMPSQYLSIDALCASIFAGAVCNTSIVVGALAASAARAANWSTLRPADCAWTMREHLAANDRIFRS